MASERVSKRCCTHCRPGVAWRGGTVLHGIFSFYILQTLMSSRLVGASSVVSLPCLDESPLSTNDPRDLLEAWIRGQANLRAPRTYGFLAQENQGTDSARQTMVLISQQLAGQYSYRVAIRKHNLIVQQPYALEATLDCLRPYESENISSEILRRASKVKWYADGVRIRRTASQQVLYHLSGHKKATLVIQIPDDRVTSDEVSGRYRCDIYKKGEVVLQRTYDIRYFRDCGYHVSGSRWNIRRRFDCPMKAAMEVRQRSLTWALVSWTLQPSGQCFGNVSSIWIRQNFGPEHVVANPAVRGEINLTDLQPASRIKLRIRTHNNEHQMTSLARTLFFFTDSVVSIRCRPKAIIARVKSDVTVACSILSQPSAAISLSTAGDVAPRGKYVSIFEQRLYLNWKSFKRQGSDEQTCITAANKYNKVTHCIKKIFLCESLQAPINGYVDIQESKTSKSVAYFRCQDGYYMKGHRTLRCLTKTAEWSGKVPVCQKL